MCLSGAMYYDEDEYDEEDEDEDKYEDEDANIIMKLRVR